MVLMTQKAKVMVGLMLESGNTELSAGKGEDMESDVSECILICRNAVRTNKGVCIPKKEGMLTNQRMSCLLTQ